MKDFIQEFKTKYASPMKKVYRVNFAIIDCMGPQGNPIGKSADDQLIKSKISAK